MRFSIKTLLGISTLVGVSCAGLIIATPAWSAAFFTAAFLLALATIVAAIVRRGPARAYWIGFAVFANGYFWLAMYVDGHLAESADRFAVEWPRLVTTNFLMDAYGYTSTLRSSGQSAAQGQNVNGMRFGPGMYVANELSEDFLQIGQSLFTLLFGLIGGWLGSWFHRRDATADPNHTTAS